MVSSYLPLAVAKGAGWRKVTGEVTYGLRDKKKIKPAQQNWYPSVVLTENSRTAQEPKGTYHVTIPQNKSDCQTAVRATLN